MIEEDAERLDLYAHMASEDQGLTTISVDKRPFVRINRQLSTASHRTNRLRSTLAHEFYHLVFHAPYYQQKLQQRDLFQRGEEQIVYTRHTILHPKKVDWREWQATYGAGALLIPITALRDVIREHSNLYGFPPYIR